MNGTPSDMANYMSGSGDRVPTIERKEYTDIE